MRYLAVSFVIVIWIIVVEYEQNQEKGSYVRLITSPYLRIDLLRAVLLDITPDRATFGDI